MSGTMKRTDEIEKLAHRIKRSATKRFLKDMEEFRKARAH